VVTCEIKMVGRYSASKDRYISRFVSLYFWCFFY